MKNLKRTTEEVKIYFTEHGCKLMDKYTGCQEPMDYKCNCGRFATTTWNNFSRGKRCGYCTKWRHKYHISEIKQMFLDRGFELLETVYENNKKTMKYRCKCGEEAMICLTALLYQNQSCKKCGFKKISEKLKGNHNSPAGSNHYCWIVDREALRQKQLFKKKFYKMLNSTLKATGKPKVGHTSDMLGYTPKELREYIENHTNWLKVKEGVWHLDHIFPMEAFVEYKISDSKIINALDNLQPLTQAENNRKHAKYDKENFLEWLRSKGVIV